jgi:hypothetical protein
VAHVKSAYLTHGFKVGQFVKILPHSMAFISGDSYGTVAKLGRKYIHVKGHSTGYQHQLFYSSVERA